MENKPLWTITRVLEWTKQYFANKGIENPRLDAEILLCAVLKCERITLYVHFDQPLDDTELAEYRSYVTRRANQEPLAYILGTKAFMKHSFKVTPAVLVPRPETELLVESVAKAAVGAGAENLLDIGTGSGVLAIGALLLGAASAEGVDIDEMCVRTAAENAALNGVDSRFIAKAGNLSDKASGTYNIITANIVANAIISLSPAVKPLLAEGGLFIASGIIDEREQEVAAAIEAAGLKVQEIRRKNGWVCILAR